jgi:hypothetical protein
VLQAMTHCHVRGNAPGGVVGEDLFVIVGGHTGCSLCINVGDIDLEPFGSKNTTKMLL